MLVPTVVSRRVLRPAGTWYRRAARPLAGGAGPPGLRRPAHTVSMCRLQPWSTTVAREYSEEIVARDLHKNVIGGVSNAVTLRLHRGCLAVQNPLWPVDDVFLSLAWLRDHCRCRLCYNRATFQRQTDVRELQFDAHPLHFNVNADGTVLEIIWHDGHQSEYSLQWLWENSYVGSRHRRQRQDRLWQRCLWEDRQTPVDLFSVPHDTFMASEEGVRRLMKGFLMHGAAIVTGVAPSLDATQKVVERVGVVQHTMFGGMWEFAADGKHADTAYGRDELLPHTDGTYYSEAPGVQVFHCLEHDGVGGETTLVDGFAGLQRLFDTDPAAYRLLSSVPCAGEYRDPDRGIHLVGDGPVIVHLPDAEPAPRSLLQLRFNPYDRAAARRGEPAQLEAFYREYGRLAELLWAERRRRRLKLTPGNVLLLDNWRVLHGRTGFTGRRHMCGAYVARGDVMSRARHAGLLI